MGQAFETSEVMMYSVPFSATGDNHKMRYGGGDEGIRTLETVSRLLP